MKYLKTFFAFMLMAVLSIGQVWAADQTITIKYDGSFSPTLPTASGSVNTTSTAHTIAGLAIKEQGIYKGSSNSYLMFVQNKGFLYNTTSLGTIKSLAVTYTSGTSDQGKAYTYFGSTEQSTYTTTSNATINKTNGDTWSNSTSGNGFFQLSTSNKNVQITQIVITYEENSGGGGQGSGGSEEAGEGAINFGSTSGYTNVNAASVTGADSRDKTWTVTTVGTTSFTPNAGYAQIGSSSKPATSITFTTTLKEAMTVTAFSAKFGGFSGTAGSVKLKVGETEVGNGSLNGTSDVTINASNTTTSGTVLTVTVTGISKGVKAYYISYTVAATGGSGGGEATNPTISTHPASASYAVGATPIALSVSATASENGGTLHYQWKSNTTNSTEGATNVGTDAATYTPSTASAGTTYYFCVVSDDNGSINSNIATIDVVAPLTTMQAIFDAATTAGSSATDVYIDFQNWVVSGAKDNSAYVTDGTNGFIVYYSNHGFTEGDILSGVGSFKIKLYNGAAELTAKNSGTITITKEGTATLNELDATAIGNLSGVNTGSLIKISGQCIVDNSKYYIKYGSGDNDKVQVYNTLYAFGSLTANANYECTGVYVQFNTTKEICPRSAADLVQEVEKNQPETQWVAATKTVRMGDATTNWWSTSSDGAKSFSSSNTEVATITNAGVITLVAPGSTTLTFSTAETSNYYSGKATLTLTVKAALPIGGTEFTWDATAQEYSDKEVLSTVTEAPNPIITFAKTGTTDPQWYNNGSAVRFYKDNSITVTAPDNKLLYQIEINFVSGYVKTLTTDVEAYSVEGTVGTWSGMAKEVTFSNGDGAARLTSINVIYANGTVTELEIANINLKTTDSETALSITKNVDATIEYTGLDESVATISNNKVTPVGVGSTTVTASIAAGSNYTAASTTFTITVSAKAIPEMSFPQASYNANLGESFTAPVLTKPEGVTVQYSSNNAAVSVDENTGAIMLNTEGSAVITATSVENDNYAVGTASYTLNVTDPYKDVLTAIGIGQSSYGDWSNKTFTTEVKYTGNSTTGTGDKSGTIQMRVQNPSGIVSTSTIGYLKNISATATKNGTNTLEIYAKNTAYESGADLYEGSTSGTLIGTIAAGGGEMVFEDGHAYSDNYKYIGIKAKGGAVYYDEIVIKWTPATFNKYTVIYKAGAATGDDVVVNNIEEGTTIQLQDNSYSYEGHIFVGWSDGTNVYEEGDEYTVNGNVTFTAQWAEQYTVTYNPGAAGGDAIVRTVAAGAYNLEAGNIFTYEGHAFDGWLKGETKYSAGASYTISENVAFTAQWVESQDPVTVTFVAGTDKSATMSLVKEGISLSYETSGGTFNRDDDYRCYSGKTLTIASEVGNITNIAFTLTQNTFTTETGVYETGSWSGNAASIEFATSGGQVRMTQIAVTYIPDGSTPKQPAGLSYDQTSYSIAQNEGFTAPTLNNPNNLAVTYSGNNDEVATVNTQTGAITLGEATGTVTITANAAAQGDFLAGTASYTLTVNAPIVIDDLSGTWALVTDASQLVVGKKVIIASVPVEGAATTMSTTQAANNRLGLAGATVSEGVITAQNGTAVFTIAAGTVENTIAFKSSANEYLYAASSGSNYIRSQAENDANGSWTVSFNEGVATITAQGEFTRNVMRHNPNTSGDNPLFACYASSSTTGTLITLYMLEEESPVTPDPEPETPDYTREVTANRYGTICIPQGGRMVDAILFEIAWHSVGEQKIYFDEIVDGTMVPGRPYIFWPKNTTIGVIYSEETPAATADSYNGLVGSFTEQTIADNDENYILYANNFYLVNIEGAAKVGANKAYVHMGDVRTTEQPQAPGRRRVSMGVQGEQVATDILNAELNAQPMKVIIDNQLFIIREGKKYDMTGNLVK